MWTANLEEIIPTLKETDFPVEVLAETTGFCNLRCSMCPQKTLKRPKGEMSFDIFKKIVDEIAIENTSTRLWLAIMGEALLLGDRLIEMIMYAKNAGIESVNLNTNAMLMDPDMSEKLISSGLDEVIIGLDAVTAATYEKIRVGGDFNKVVGNVTYLLEQIQERGLKSPNLLIQFIIMDENEHEVEEYKEYWLSKGASLKIRPKIQWGTAVESKYLDLPDSARTFPCPMLIRNCAIHWDGTIAHCSDADFEGNYSAGSVVTQTIREVWNGELASRRRKHWDLNFDHPLCSQCRDWQTGRSLYYTPGK